MKNYIILIFILLLTLFIDYTENMTNNQPADNQSDNNQPDNNQPTDNQPANNQSDNNQPDNNQPVDTQPDNNQPANNQPTDNQPVDTQPANNQPVDTQPTDTQPANNQPVDNQLANNQPTELTRDNVIEYIKKHNLCSLEKDNSGYLKTLTIKKTRDIHIDNIYANISGIVIYDKNGKVINNWFNESLSNFLEATIVSNSPLFIKDGNDAKPSSIMTEQLGVNFEMLKDYYTIKNAEFAGKDLMPLIILKSNLDNDIYGYPKFPTADSTNKFNGNYQFYGDLIINFRNDNMIHLSDISKIRIIHSITTDNSKPANHISGNIYLTEDAWKLTRYNLELTNNDGKVIISEPIGNNIVNYNQRNFDSSKRIMTEINL